MISDCRMITLQMNKIPNKSVEPTPLSFAVLLFLGSLFILFLSIILFAKRGSSPQTLYSNPNHMYAQEKRPWKHRTTK